MSSIMRKQVDEVNQFSGRAASGPAELFESMHTILHLYRARRQRAARSDDEGGDGLAHMEMKALGFFARHPGAAQSDLVAHSGRDKAQVARLIRVLRERGLLAAVPDEQDRRSVRLSLSEAGAAVHAALHRHDGGLAAVALGGLDAQEQAVLAELLARIRANLEAPSD
jgi:DNA-binding MarR family transcriptional regulator